MFRRFEFPLMLVALFLFFVLNHAANAASFTARDVAGNRLTISDKPCSQSGWLKDWKHADLTYQGKPFTACWKPMGEYIAVIDHSGDVFPFPIALFTKDADA